MVFVLIPLDGNRVGTARPVTQIVGGVQLSGGGGEQCFAVTSLQGAVRDLALDGEAVVGAGFESAGRAGIDYDVLAVLRLVAHQSRVDVAHQTTRACFEIYKGLFKPTKKST